ncbi:signal peptidase I [Virgibacillus sp. CBA3643]|uniref:signal peptidase I n=1 Tax=Virgibacillus sp. CBA3643 TaxID=2942278 RepID=UPI0035A2918E
MAGSNILHEGDNNNAPDVEPVLAENIVGEYTGFTIPYVGYAVHFSQSSEGVLLLLLVPGVLLIVYSVFTMGRALRQIEELKEPDKLVSTSSQDK